MRRVRGEEPIATLFKLAMIACAAVAACSVIDIIALIVCGRKP